jgi:hypothetical protein
VSQEDVSGEDVEAFTPTLEAYLSWLRKDGFIGGGVASAFVTCGDWDLKTMLPIQVSRVLSSFPNCFPVSSVCVVVDTCSCQ